MLPVELDTLLEMLLLLLPVDSDLNSWLSVSVVWMVMLDLGT